MNVVTVAFVLVIAAFLCTIASAAGKCPVWVGLLLMTIEGLLRLIPR